MAVDTPATIAIIGGGPIGLEAALYARFLGYDVLLFERGEVAEHVERWGHVEMFTPFRMNSSALALAALDAQGISDLPAADAFVSGAQWRERYLLPLSQTDLLANSIHTKTEVIDVSRCEILKHELAGSADRATSQFRLLVEDPDGEQAHLADVVIDCSGVVGRPNQLGGGGGPAIGERALCSEFDYLPPNLAGADRDRFAGKTTLVVGSGYSAATTVVGLAELAEEFPETRIVWAVRHDTDSPVRRIQDDRLSTRDQLAQRANELASQSSSCQVRPLSCIQAIRRDESEKFWVRFAQPEAEEEGERQDDERQDDERQEGERQDDEQQGEENAREEVNELPFDNIVANVGFRGDNSPTEQLQVHRCYASDGPMKLAAALMGAGADSIDCLDQTSTGPTSLQNPEPNFYILGTKSYARHPNFLYAVGLEQIRDIFTLIGDRETLDLYAAMGASS
jgi:hypothetical protein